MTQPITKVNASNKQKSTFSEKDKIKTSPKITYTFKDLLDDLRLEQSEGHYNR